MKIKKISVIMILLVIASNVLVFADKATIIVYEIGESLYKREIKSYEADIINTDIKANNGILSIGSKFIDINDSLNVIKKSTHYITNIETKISGTTIEVYAYPKKYDLKYVNEQLPAYISINQYYPVDVITMPTKTKYKDGESISLEGLVTKFACYKYNNKDIELIENTVDYKTLANGYKGWKVNNINKKACYTCAKGKNTIQFEYYINDKDSTFYK